MTTTLATLKHGTRVKTKLKMHPSIQLASGRYFDFTKPETTPLSIEDIATGLSRICRYTGQLLIDENAVYTVAQHCVLASENCGDCDPFEALMHDRAESVMNDMSSPLKQLLPDYKEIEHHVEEATAKLFGVPHPMSDACKRIDLRMLATEKRDLMPGDADGDYWAVIQGVEPLPFKIVPWGPAEARARFLQRFYYLRDGVLPNREDRFATPHENAPLLYKATVLDHWHNKPGVRITADEARKIGDQINYESLYEKIDALIRKTASHANRVNVQEAMPSSGSLGYAKVKQNVMAFYQSQGFKVSATEGGHGSSRTFMIEW